MLVLADNISTHYGLSTLMYQSLPFLKFQALCVLLSNLPDYLNVFSNPTQEPMLVARGGRRSSDLECHLSEVVEEVGIDVVAARS